VFCDACAQAKPHRKPFPDQASNRATEFGERIHADLWGPASVQSLGKAWYSVDFTDDAMRWTEIQFIPSKDKTQDEYEKLDNQLETVDNVRIRHLRSDRGSEFKNSRFDRYLAKRGTKRELTVHDTHEQVGVAERLNRSKTELARAMLIDAKLPRFLWAEAMNHAIWIKNRSPTRALNGNSPYQARYNKAPDMSKLVPFGTKAWVKIVGAGKLDRRAEPGYFVGYDNESTGYRIYFPEKRIVKPEREVVFDLDQLDDSILIPAENQSEGEKRKIILDTPQQAPEATTQQRTIEQDPTPSDNDEDPPDNADDNDELTRTRQRPRTQTRPQRDPSIEHPERPRTRPTPGFFKTLHNQGRQSANLTIDERFDSPIFAMAAGGIGTEPRTLDEALEGPNADEWHTAWKAEIDQLESRGTWQIVDRPIDKPVIPSRPIFKQKLGPDGEIQKFKARIVAGGHKQVQGVNYEETFAAAAKIGSIRVVLAHAAQRDWDIDQVDVVGAYLNADLDEEVYMEAPHGVLKPHEKEKVLKLLKCIYGLKQVGRKWQKKMSKDLEEMGFQKSKVDHSVFI
jgi:hypothetical protein